MNISLKQYWDLLARHIQPQKARFALLTFLLFSSIGLQIFNPQIMRYFIDAVLAGSDDSRLLTAAIAFISIAVAQQVLSVGAAYVGENVAWNATNALRAELAQHCLKLDMSFHNDTSPGELIERIDGDVTELSNFFSQLVIRVVGNLFLMLGILIALFMEDWRVGVAFTIFASLTLIILERVRGLAVPHRKAFRESIADLFGFLEERLAGTEDIRSSGAVDFIIHGLYRLQHKIMVYWRRGDMMFLVVRFAGGFMMALGSVMVIILGFNLYKQDVLTIGTIYLLVYYLNLLGRPIRELTQQAESIQTIGAATERLNELRAITTRIVDGPGDEIAAGALALSFEDVSFSYIEEERVLDQLSFQLKPGKVLGLLGRTGSGKTTITRLIFRLYDPTGGTVRLNDVDIRQPKVKELRKRVAMVTQDVQLFQATVRDNLTFFNPAIPDESILAVIDELGLQQWYEALPDGLDTRLQSGGRGLSAGEGQLLAFTRVFLSNPDLVILDEASSRLDPATEELIERAVDKLLENRTAIIVAHRLGTVHRADEIMILEKGKLVEHDAREQLANDPNSRFFHLLQTGLEEVLA